MGHGKTKERGRPSRAGVAEGIRLLPGLRERAAISQPRVGAGGTGDPRRGCGRPVGPGSPEGCGSYLFMGGEGMLRLRTEQGARR